VLTPEQNPPPVSVHFDANARVHRARCGCGWTHSGTSLWDVVDELEQHTMGGH
jgi:hypothetical protein